MNEINGGTIKSKKRPNTSEKHAFYNGNETEKECRCGFGIFGKPCNPADSKPEQIIEWVLQAPYDSVAGSAPIACTVNTWWGRTEHNYKLACFYCINGKLSLALFRWEAAGSHLLPALIPSSFTFLVIVFESALWLLLRWCFNNLNYRWHNNWFKCSALYWTIWFMKSKHQIKIIFWGNFCMSLYVYIFSKLFRRFFKADIRFLYSLIISWSDISDN